jgi:DNA-binding CsgD family transcriptional regulator
MHHDPFVQHLFQELLKTISCFNLTIPTRTVAKMKGIIQHYIMHVSSRVNFSTILIDLKEQQLVLHTSIFNRYFENLILNTTIRNNLEHFIGLTCPLNICFCLQTEIIIMNHLLELTTEELREYEARYIQNLMEKDGLYHSYVIYIQVYEFDEFGRPWILKIETKRSEVRNLPEFRWFSHSLEDYTEKHAYSCLLQNLKLTDGEKTVLLLLTEGKTMTAIGIIMIRSPYTVQSYYKSLKQKMNVHSVQEVREIGRILGY